MISISHSQARRLLQLQLDERELPEAQWAELQAHLEECAECRAYRDRLALAGRSLRRALRQRWESVNGPAAGIAAEMAALFRERKEIRRKSFWMVGSAAAFLLFSIWFVAWAANLLSGGQAANLLSGDRAIPLNTQPTATQTPLPTPTRPAVRYPGVVAYEVRTSGDNGEIYLLNPGADPVNLTNHPADDSAPAWSPDGQWLAFLSDRAGRQGKDEVYVMHVSGTRLTRLTDLPEVAWSGPLSWSADGQMLALIGERKIGETSETWVYLVPLDGSNAYPLGYSTGAIHAAFSPVPKSRLLAFSGGKKWERGLVIYDFDPQGERFLMIDEAGISGSSIPTESNASVGLFEWSADGRRLLFKKNHASQSNLTGSTLTQADLRTVDISGPQDLINFSSQMAVGSAPPTDFPAFSWTGIQDEMAYLVDTDNPPPGDLLEDRCRILRMGATTQSISKMIEVTGVCIEGGLERANWRTAQKSVLVVGRKPGDKEERGLFIVRFRGNTARAEWLAGAQDISGPPRLRPTGSPLAIDPQPVRAAASLPPSPLPGPEVGDLLVISTLNERTLINRLAPGSSRRTLINQSFGQNGCPTWSPDHERIAFLSNRAIANISRADIFTDLFIINGSGLDARRLTEASFQPGGNGALAPSRSNCPVWSPDGRWLAFPYSTPAMAPGYIFAFIPLDQKDRQPLSILPPPDMSFNQMAWLPDGRLAVAHSGAGRIVLYAYNPKSGYPVIETLDQPLASSPDWTDTTAMILSPDGKTLALAVSRTDPRKSSTYALLTLHLDSTGLPAPGDMAFSWRHNLHSRVVGNSLHWLPDGRLAYILRYPAGRSIKAAVYAIRPGEHAPPERLASFPHTFFAAAWTPNGRWLTAITETGRYVIDLTLAPAVRPAWVDGETGVDINS